MKKVNENLKKKIKKSKVKKKTIASRGDFFLNSGTYAGGAKYCPKKYNIDYFGYAANL